MTEREQVAHLLRRFGLGAGKLELDEYAKLGRDGTLERLIEYEKVDEGFPVSPWEFAAEADGTLNVEPFRFASWWALRMVLTRRPLQERLTLFWHNHFAVSANKVFDGVSMLRYMQTLRSHAAGNFRTLLKAVSKEPAMLYFLDNAASTKDNPNENFSRELLELFTLGRGAYTEADVREAARAFTGWQIHFSGLGEETPFDQLVQRAARNGRSVFSFCIVPDNHDFANKTILGQTKNFDGDAVLDLLAGHEATATRIVTKLWEWFAYPNPPQSVVQRLTRVFLASNLEIKPVLREIARSNEFWSDACVLKRAKSPVDFTVSFLRQLGLGAIVLALRGAPRTPFTPIVKEVRGLGDGAAFLMNTQGLLLLFPPDVGGWAWGPAWITSANMLARIRHAQILFQGDDPNRPISQFLAQRIKQAGAAQTSERLVAELLALFDANVSADVRSALIAACEKAGGPPALDDKERASQLFVALGTTLFAAPEFQLC